MNANIINLPKKPRESKLRKTLIYIVVISLILWSFDSLNYQGVMITARGTIQGMISGFLNPILVILQTPL